MTKMPASNRAAAARCRRVLAVLLAFAGAAAMGPAAAAEWFVQSGGSGVAFVPQLLTITAGDTVTFINRGGYHNVVADDGSFRCAHGCDNDGNGGSGNASSTFWRASVVFPTAGTVGYFCEPHGAPGIGMYGTITVLAPAPPPQPAPLGGAWLAALLAGTLAVAAMTESMRRARRRAAPDRNGND